MKKLVLYSGMTVMIMASILVSMSCATRVGDGFRVYSKKNSLFEYELSVPTGWGPDAGYRTVKITGYRGNAKEVIIPNEIDGGKVNFIGENAFRAKQLTSVTFENRDRALALFRIEAGAFADNQLTNIVINERIGGIEREAFDNNPLVSVTIERYRHHNREFGIRAFGDFTPFFGINSGQLGTYTKRGEDWYFNDTRKIIEPATLELTGGVHIRSISGIRNPSPAFIYSFVNTNQFNRVFYIPPGEYTIEVFYDDRLGGYYGTRTAGTVTFRQQYVFERGTYQITSRRRNNMIEFYFSRR